MESLSASGCKALLFIEAERMQVSEIVAALRGLRPAASGATLRRWAYELRRAEMQLHGEATVFSSVFLVK